jgi:hypothetical protein
MFGGAGTIPNNMRSYLMLGAYAGFHGGVAEHDNNGDIPSSGTVFLSDFASPADKDFVSDNYTAATSTVVVGEYFEVFTGYASNDAALQNFGFGFLSSVGASGSRDNVGKSTYGSSGQTAEVQLIGDWNISDTTGVVIGFSGDHRATGWGGAGGGIQAPYYIVLNNTTYYMADSVVPNGSFNTTHTYWAWTGAGSGLVDGTFTFEVGIY